MCSLSLCVYGQYNESVLYAIRETAADDSNNIAIFQIQMLGLCKGLSGASVI